MGEYRVYYTVAAVFAIMSVIVFITLFYITAPYGRHSKASRGPFMSRRVGWIIMESPASVLLFLFFLAGENAAGPGLVVFFLLWQAHYMYRSFIYPLSLPRAGRMPVSIIIPGFLFNVVNSYLQGMWFFSLCPAGTYSSSWFLDPRFIAGFALFFTGLYINRKADRMLRELRGRGEGGYSIPRGWLYELVSCPNYMGEIIEWTGWAVMTWSLPGLIFAIWTFANLFPRARSHHLWYRQNFPEYPDNRKAVIPGIF